MTNEQRSALETLAAEGRLEPSIVVETARPSTSVLHSLFEWDVTKAAQAHWLEKARELIRTVRVEIRTETTRIVIPRYVKNPSKSPVEQGYVETTSIPAGSDLAREAVQRELDLAIAHIRRAERIGAVLGFAEEVQQVLEAAIALKARSQAA